MFFSKKKSPGLLSDIKAGGNISLSVGNVTINGDQTVDVVGGKVFINGQHVANVDERKIEIHIAPKRSSSISSQTFLSTCMVPYKEMWKRGW